LAVPQAMSQNTCLKVWAVSSIPTSEFSLKVLMLIFRCFFAIFDRT